MILSCCSVYNSHFPLLIPSIEPNRLDGISTHIDDLALVVGILILYLRLASIELLNGRWLVACTEHLSKVIERNHNLYIVEGCSNISKMLDSQSITSCAVCSSVKDISIWRTCSHIYSCHCGVKVSNIKRQSIWICKALHYHKHFISRHTNTRLYVEIGSSCNTVNNSGIAIYCHSHSVCSKRCSIV